MPSAIAAAQVAKIAVIANNNPANGYGGVQVSDTLITLFKDNNDLSNEWAYSQRDEALKKGSSNFIYENNVLKMSDVVTFYNPTGDEDPAYRYVVNIIKLQNILYNLKLIFDSPEWKSAPLIPDNQDTVNPLAKKPKMAKSAIATVLDGLALEAIISDPDTAKDSIVAEIDSMNPNRLNVSLTVQLSGNTDIVSLDANFGFFFGTQTFLN